MAFTFTPKGVLAGQYKDLTPEEKARIQSAGEAEYSRYSEIYKAQHGGVLSAFDEGSAMSGAQELAQRMGESIFTQRSQQLAGQQVSESEQFNQWLASQKGVQGTVELPQHIKGFTTLGNLSDYVVQNGILTTRQAIQEGQAQEAAVAAGTMKKVPIGSGFGYIPTGSAAELQLQGKTFEQQLATPSVQQQIQQQGLQPIAPTTQPTGTIPGTATQPTTGTIKQGDTLSQIVQRLGITPQEFLKLNPQFAATGKPGDYQGLTGLVQPGQTYVIPGTGGVQQAGTQPTAQTYTVQKGDTLSSIARKMGVNINDITGYRSGNPNLIYPGEVLSVGGAGGTPQGISGAQVAGVTMPAPTVSPQIEQSVQEAGLTSTEFQTSPITSFETYFQSLLTSAGLPTLKSNVEDYNKQLQALRDEKTKETQEINDNPWISETLRLRKIANLDTKYEQRESNLLRQIQISQDQYDKGFEQAKFFATTALSQYNQDREFQADQLELSARRAERMAEMEISFQGEELKQELTRAQIESVRALTKKRLNEIGGGPSPDGTIFDGLTGDDGSVVTVGSDVDILSRFIQNNKFKFTEKESAALSVIFALDDLAKYNPEGNFEGIGAFLRKPSILQTEEGRRNRQYLEAINLTTQFWASGAALTERQTKQVKKLTPDKNDTDSQVRDKINGLANYMLQQIKGAAIKGGVRMPITSINYDFSGVSIDEFDSMNSIIQ